MMSTESFEKHGKWPDLKIKSVEAVPFKIPYKENQMIRSKVFKANAAEHVLIRVLTDDGLEGVAEAPSRPGIYGETQEAIRSIINQSLGPLVTGADPLNIRMIRTKMDTAVPFNLTAKAAVELAIFDIIGKTLHLPCGRLLGGYKPRIPLTWVIHLKKPGDVAAETAKIRQELGIASFKLKVGEEPARDIETVKLVRKAVGEDAVISVDGNQGYDADTAIKTLNKMKDYDISWVEEPCPVSDSKGRLRLAQSVPIPIMGDESCFTVKSVYEEIKLGALGIVSIKIARTSFQPSRAILDLCQCAHVRNLVGTQADSSIGLFYGLHFASAHSEISLPNEIHPGTLHASDHLTTEPLIVKDGCMEVPTKPGLGIEIDESKVRKYSIG
jgi:L-alanine-DL-glutamate epimerase-like enolase superfamily enzyme